MKANYGIRLSARTPDMPEGQAAVYYFVRESKGTAEFTRKFKDAAHFRTRQSAFNTSLQLESRHPELKRKLSTHHDVHSISVRSNPSHGIKKLNGAQVRMLFKADWHTVVKYAPDLANDLPAKREHFANYVDMLHRDGRISDRTAHSVTMPGDGRKGKRVLSNPHKAGSANKVEARELLLFAENDGDLYRMQVGPIQKNLTKKFKAGKYSSTKAAKLWTYLADNAAKKYTFEHGDRGAARSWHQVKGYGIFTAATRRLVGRLLEKSWHAEMKAGNFHA